MVDEFTREHVGFLVDRSITGGKLVELLDILCLKRGYLAVLRMDNGPEFVSKHLEAWSKENQTKTPTTTNPKIRPFHNRKGVGYRPKVRTMSVKASMGRSSLSNSALSGQGSIEWIVIVGLVITVLAVAWNAGLRSAIESLWKEIVQMIKDITGSIKESDWTSSNGGN